ncbi:MAG: hypothetical protein FWF44_03800 [Defluviitaleaceae bacterium]|nr:hypothetical protein [Defluviitaleaceae bacterium]
MKTCQFCGDFNEDDLETCPKCGNALLPSCDRHEKLMDMDSQMAEAKRRVFGLMVMLLTMASATIILFAVNLIPFTHHVDRTLNGVKCRLGNQDEATQTSVYINGNYTQYLLHWAGKLDSFSGMISVQDAPLTAVTNVHMTFTNNWSAMSYDFNQSDIEAGAIDYTNVPADIYCTPGFSKVFMLLFEPIPAKVDTSGVSNGYSIASGLILCCPAESREDAIQIAKSLSSSSDSFMYNYWQLHPDGTVGLSGDSDVQNTDAP